MKYIIYLLLFSSTFSYAQSINWLSFNEALEAQKIKPKKIIMDVYTEWCGPCKMMDKNTFANRDVLNYINENFYAVKFNGEGNEKINFFDQEFTNPEFIDRRKGRNSTHQLTKFLQVDVYPTIIFFSEEGDPIIPVKGYLNPREIELYLKLIKKGDYFAFRSEDDFEKYKKYFRPKFRN
ncbi:MAG: thioredoxin fold domain-containing protein [Bacteroidota bacterium]|nr:thioredoxin fold domain-containing protein [Bacteroidota bacterium]|tara:strand:+ start:3207 stop:3743 length:537 start_codon:yes stop_codon:yes gene_type:complete